MQSQGPTLKPKRSYSAVYGCIISLAIVLGGILSLVVVAYLEFRHAAYRMYNLPPAECEERFVEPYVIDAVPKSMHIAKVLRTFDPALGDGDCTIAYQMSPSDFDSILKGKTWERGWPTEIVDLDAHNQIEKTSAGENLFRAVWPKDPGPFETYHVTAAPGVKREDLGTTEMVVSADHTRAVFFISDL